MWGTGPAAWVVRLCPRLAVFLKPKSAKWLTEQIRYEGKIPADVHEVGLSNWKNGAAIRRHGENQGRSRF